MPLPKTAMVRALEAMGEWQGDLIRSAEGALLAVAKGGGRHVALVLLLPAANAP
jgi:hypothetical protein